MNKEVTIGPFVRVSFGDLNGKVLKGKVDTGATTSCLHATDIEVDEQAETVTFMCDFISPNRISMNMVGSQRVQSANHDGDTRPVVSLNVEIDGTSIGKTSFNLNDRSEMDAPVLIGQNTLKQGNFVVDVDKHSEEGEAAEQQNAITREAMIASVVSQLLEACLTPVELLSIIKSLNTNDTN